MLWTMATPNHKIWLSGIENGKLLLSCAIVAAFVVGGSLAAESPKAAANGIPANQVSPFSAHPYGLVNQEEERSVGAFN